MVLYLLKEQQQLTQSGAAAGRVDKVAVAEVKSTTNNH